MAVVEQATRDFLSTSYGKSFKSTGTVPSLDLEGGKSVSGVCSIAKHLQRTASDYGDLSLEHRMEVEQWVEYATTTVRMADSESERGILKELDNFLKDKAYFVANQLTVADIVMYHNLFSLFAALSFQEKELYIHVSRWFHNVQQDKKVRQSLQRLPFLRTSVYDGLKAH